MEWILEFLVSCMALVEECWEFALWCHTLKFYQVSELYQQGQTARGRHGRRLEVCHVL